MAHKNKKEKDETKKNFEQEKKKEKKTFSKTQYVCLCRLHINIAEEKKTFN